MLRTTILLITLPLAASAQSTQQQSHGSASPSKVTPIYSRVPFDINATQLPAHFKGHDIALLYRAFQRIESVDKSEYETTERFNERVATLTLKPVIGTISAKSTLAFVALDLVADYDADHELLTAGVRGSFSTIQPFVRVAGLGRRIRSLGRPSIVIKQSVSKSRYIGSNAFGASAIINKAKVSQFHIAISNQNDFSTASTTEGSNTTIGTTIAIDSDRARRMKTTLAALVVCSMNEKLLIWL